ncbi:hypothetical protein SLE2022_315870 [Rubroshorea leprosula]
MAAAKLVLKKRPKLFWSSCASHAINLMFEGISKLPQFDGIISKAKNLTIFLHTHRRTLNMMRRITLRRDIVKLGVTKFATTFLTLQSLFEKKGKLMFMFSSDDWSMCKLSSSYKGMEASATVLSIKFWEGVNRCLKVFGPLVKVLLLGLALACIEKFFMDDPETMKLVQNVKLLNYRHREDWFDKVGAVVDRWSNWGLKTLNLQNMSMRILSLTASASGCERNWSTFQGIHTKKRKRLEASRMNDWVFIQFNAKLSIKNERAKENGDVLLTRDDTNAQGWMVENGDINEEDSLVPGDSSVLWFTPASPLMGELNEDLDESSDGEPVEEVGFADSDEDRVMLFEGSDDDGP